MIEYKIDRYYSNNLDEIMQIWNEAIDEGKTLACIEHFLKQTIASILNNHIEKNCALSDLRSN